MEVRVLADYSLGESPEVRLDLQQQQGYNFSVGGLGGLGLFLLTRHPPAHKSMNQLKQDTHAHAGRALDLCVPRDSNPHIFERPSFKSNA